MSSFANALDDSIRAAAAEGPKTGRERLRKRSATPAASGTSGPTTVRVMFSPSAHDARPSPSDGSRSTGAAIRAIPGFGRVAKNVADGWSRLSFQRSACSRPPFPMTRVFMVPMVSGREGGVKARRASPGKGQALSLATCWLDVNGGHRMGRSIPTVHGIGRGRWVPTVSVSSACCEACPGTPPGSRDASRRIMGLGTEMTETMLT